jgi:chromosome segregation ATPase
VAVGGSFDGLLQKRLRQENRHNKSWAAAIMRRMSVVTREPTAQSQLTPPENKAAEPTAAPPFQTKICSITQKTGGKVTTKKSEKLAAQIADAQKQEAKLQSTVSAVVERLAKLKTAYQCAVESDEAEDALDTRDEEIVRCERELARAQIKLTQRKNEIASLESERAAALRDEREADFRKLFDDLCESFTFLEMALSEFQAHKDKIEAGIRTFMNEASATGRDVHRLRLTDNIRRQLIERLFPGYQSKHSDAYTRPLADILEEHCRVALGIPRLTNGKAKPSELLNEGGIHQ